MDCKEKQTPQGKATKIFGGVFRGCNYFHCFLNPNGAFERRRYMNIVVHKAKHPHLRKYIHSVLHGLFPFMQKGLVERVVLIFFNNENVLIQRFVFMVNVNQSYGSMVEEADFQFSLRSFLIKFPFSESLTKVLNRGCGWEITAYFRSLSEPIPKCGYQLTQSSGSNLR